LKALNARVNHDAPPDESAAHRRSLGSWRRPLVALLGLMLIIAAELFGIAASSQPQQPDGIALFSCGACHD
jgi:hypothetical protein